jgi:hypothetical protein
MPAPEGADVCVRKNSLAVFENVEDQVEVFRVGDARLSEIAYPVANSMCAGGTHNGSG